MNVVDHPGAALRDLAAFLRFRGGSYPIELQVLDAPDGRWRQNRFAHARDEAEALRLAAEADRWGAPGVYLVAGQIDPAVATRAPAGRWHPAIKGESTSDSDIRERLLLFVDVDPRRARGTSATDAECAAARDVAERVMARLIEAFGPGAVASGSSGNGVAIFVALEGCGLCAEPVKSILASLDALYSSPAVHVDPSVSDPKRLCPAFGTMKRKGAPGIAERPHRRSTFSAPAQATRVGLHALERLAAELRAEAAAAAPPAPARPPTPRPAPPAPSDDPFARANALPVREVLAWLGLLEGEQPTCPGCRESDGTSVAIVGNGLRCMHARCAGEGVPPGFRSVVDIVAKSRGSKPIEAVRELGARFGFDVPKRPAPAPDRRSGHAASAPSPASAHDVSGQLVIRCGVRIDLVTDAAAEALASDENMYQRDGQLVRVVRVAEDEADALSLVGTPTIRAVAAATLTERLAAVARWARLDKHRDPEEWVPCMPQKEVVAALAARGQWRGVRPIAGILETPAMRPDGTLILEPGYDSTGYLLLPGAELDGLRVPESPTQSEANSALVELCEIWRDFPFASEAQRMVPVAALLTLIARPAILGSCPAIVVDAPTRGTGKTLTLDAVSVVATGRIAAKMSWPPDEVELEKVLASYALRGAGLVNFDNISTRFGGGPLDKVLTCGDRVELRVLGRSEVPSLRWRALVTASGNNVELAGDTARRTLWARMESTLEHPEDRSDFAHPNLLAWCTSNRQRLVRAALTILRAYVTAGRPDMGLGQWGSFEAWAAIVPPAIAYAGGPNVLDARPVKLGHEEPEKNALSTILESWTAFAGPSGATARDAIQRLYPHERLRGQAAPDGHDGLREAIETLVPTRSGSAPSPKSLGNVLSKMRRRVVGGRMLDKREDRKGFALWYVASVGAGP